MEYRTKRLSLAWATSTCAIRLFSQSPAHPPQFVNGVVVNGVEGKGGQSSQPKNKAMDSVKPASIATPQAGYKLYAHNRYLRGLKRLVTEILQANFSLAKKS